MEQRDPEFLREFVEVITDLQTDLRESMTDMDPVVCQRVTEYVIALFKAAEGDAVEAVKNLMSGMLWMFMAGREHAVRGYASPKTKQYTDADNRVVDEAIRKLLGET